MTEKSNSIIADLCIENLEIKKLRQISGIYFLFNGKELVYIGSSIDILSRVSQHKKYRNGHGQPKNFDGYSYIEIAIEDLLEVESVLIAMYKPCLNKKSELHNNPLIISVDKIKQTLKEAGKYSMASRLKSTLKKANLSPFCDPYKQKQKYYYLNDVEALFDIKLK